MTDADLFMATFYAIKKVGEWANTMSGFHIEATVLDRKIRYEAVESNSRWRIVGEDYEAVLTGSGRVATIIGNRDSMERDLVLLNLSY